MKTIPHGSKLGLHAIYPNQAMPLVRQAKDKGFVWPVVKGVDNAGLAMDVKAIEPRTLTITRFVSHWDSAQGIEMWPDDYMREAAKEVILYAVDRLNPEERAAADWIEVLNEADPPGVEGWRAFGRWLCYVVHEANQAGIKVALPAFNFGTPEWDEMVALAESGVFGLIRAGGHLLSVHEGVEPFGIEPLMTGLIPGAPSVAGAGPKVYRYRYLNHLLEQRGETCNMVVSEFYAGGGYFINNIDNVLARFMQYDAQIRRDPYVLGFLPFTIDPNPGWAHQNYTPHLTHPQTLAYMLAESTKPNIGIPTPMPPETAPPAPSRLCRYGVHGRADGRLQPADLAAIRLAGMEAVKLMSTASVEDVKALDQIRPDMFILVRLFADLYAREATPADFVSWVEDDMRQFYDLGLRYFEIHNEPNLIAEGLGASWVNGTTFAEWFIEVYERLKFLFPEAQLGFPGLSPGPTVEHVRMEEYRFWQQAQPAIDAADWVGVHAYWQNATEMQSEAGGLSFLRLLRERPDKTFFLTEFANQGSESFAAKGAQYRSYLAALRNTERLAGAFCFVVSASNGFDSQVWRDEDGQLNAIPGELAKLATSPAPAVGMQATLIGNVILRQGPSSNYRRLTALYTGSRFPVQEARGDWLRITDDGWVKRSYVKLS